ncbi:MAG: proline racemase family protein [Actinomycetota bacterium]|nr:proline racemase family protein [Actinomycetota bacterium]
MVTERIRTVDYHTGGEPFRIVPEPPVALPGSSVADRRARAGTDPASDGLRRLLCFEPRGHADMYGGFLVPPDDDGAQLGVLFWHKDGFSTACGHGTIALATWAVESGRVQAPQNGTTDVVVDVPSGRVTARVQTEDGAVTSVDFVNVPGYLVAEDVAVSTSRGEVRVAVAYGGALYAHVDVRSVGLAVVPEQYGELIALGREVKQGLHGSAVARHPSDERLSGIYGTILYEDLGPVQGGLHQRNVTIFADGELDRSPCGSGTASRVAALDATGRLSRGQVLVHDSIIGSRFRARVVGETRVDGYDAVVAAVTGRAHRTGEHVFVVDPRDDLVPGFVLR